MRTFAAFFAGAAALYVITYNLLSVLMVFLAGLEIRRQRRAIPAAARQLAADSGLLPGISVVIPAYNEQVSIASTVLSALALDYPDFEVLVINDGSTDRTLEILWQELDLVPSNDRPEPALATQTERAVFVSRTEPRLRVVDKRNSGKADALNTGINWSTRELVCAIDADVLLERDALIELALPFACDRRMVATGGMIRPLNGCRVMDGKVAAVDLPGRWLERFQLLEYLRAFGIGRLFFNWVNAHLIISGALGLFRRSLLIACGGYQVHAIGEDMELVVRLHRHLRNSGRHGRMIFAADALCWTELPQRLGELGEQRTRWHQGLLTTLRLHRAMLFRWRYRGVGLLAFPYFLVFELLSPFLELLGWALLPGAAALGLIRWQQALPFLASAVLLPGVVSSAAVLVEAMAFGRLTGFGRRLKLLGVALLEPLGYHQLMLFFRLRAFVRYYRSIHIRGGWRPPTRVLGKRPATGGG